MISREDTTFAKTLQSLSLEPHLPNKFLKFNMKSYVN